VVASFKHYISTVNYNIGTLMPGRLQIKRSTLFFEGGGCSMGVTTPFPLKGKHVQNPETMLAAQNQLRGCNGIKLRLPRPEEGCSIRDEETPIV
jgi:hypothetical protein